jgi:pimeloyl-ACP methyl ester carboxylesterase
VSGERRVVRKGAVSIEIFVGGEGPTVLMHPGFGRSARDYNDMSTPLAKAGFRPIAINPRGINASERPLEGLTLHDYADDVWMVADELELQKVNLLGHAFGNRVMRTASTDQPNRVASITLRRANRRHWGRQTKKRSMRVALRLCKSSKGWTIWWPHPRTHGIWSPAGRTRGWWLSLIVARQWSPNSREPLPKPSSRSWPRSLSTIATWGG